MNFKAFISEDRRTYKYFWFAGQKNGYDIYVTITISGDLNTNINVNIYKNIEDFCCKLRSVKEDLFMTYSNIFYDFITDWRYSLASVKYEDVISFEIFINDCMEKLSIYYGL